MSIFYSVTPNTLRNILRIQPFVQDGRDVEKTSLGENVQQHKLTQKLVCWQSALYIGCGSSISKAEKLKRKEQSKRDKDLAQKQKMQTIKQKDNGMKSKVKLYSATKDLKNSMQIKAKSPETEYIRSLLDPFNTVSVRGPNDFYMPTSLLDYKLVFDTPTSGTYNWNTGNGVMALYPANSQGQLGVNQPAMLSLINTGGGSSLGGSGTIWVNGGPLVGFVNSDITISTARVVSYRVVRCGVKIFPKANIVIKQGMCTIGMIPGKTYSYSATSIPTPTSQQLRQYPTSYEVQLANLGPEGMQYVWLPLDPADQIFVSSSLQDTEFLMGQYRSPIFAVFDNISLTDSYRFEVSITYEYVPNLNFEQWSPVAQSNINSNTSRTLSSFLKDKIPQAVSGLLATGNALNNIGNKVAKYAPYIGALF